MIPGEKITMDNLNHLIEHHMAFLIRTVSNFTGRYVSVENDDEFSREAKNKQQSLGIYLSERLEAEDERLEQDEDKDDDADELEEDDDE